MGHGVPTQGVQQQTRLQKEHRENAAGESVYCVEQSLAWQKSGLLAAFAMRVKNKTSPGRAEPTQPLTAHGEKMGLLSREGEAHSCLRPCCSRLCLLSVHLSTLKLGFLEVLQHPFFPELCECENICRILTSRMLCFLLIKTERREQVV